jgi:hypothetical protein
MFRRSPAAEPKPVSTCQAVATRTRPSSPARSTAISLSLRQLVAVPADMQDPPAALQRWYYVTYRQRLPSLRSRNRLRIVFGFARQALIVACHEGPWWQLDDWHPRCDPRIPLINREPVANYGCSPNQITITQPLPLFFRRLLP